MVPGTILGGRILRARTHVDVRERCNCTCSMQAIFFSKMGCAHTGAARVITFRRRVAQGLVSSKGSTRHVLLHQLPNVRIATGSRIVGTDSLAEWSKALASGASPQGRGLEPHSCHLLIGIASTSARSAQHVQCHWKSKRQRRTVIFFIVMRMKKNS